MTTTDKRIDELNELAAAEGFTLPWPAAVIIALEEQGHVVDLESGMVIQHGSEQRISLTALGEAVAIAYRAWEKGND